MFTAAPGKSLGERGDDGPNSPNLAQTQHQYGVNRHRQVYPELREGISHSTEKTVGKSSSTAVATEFEPEASCIPCPRIQRDLL